MIRKFAHYRGIGDRRQVSPAMPAHSNDNHVLRRVFSNPQRMPKRVLVCHWRVRPQTGALECVWETQAAKRPADAVIDEDPKIRWPRRTSKPVPTRSASPGNCPRCSTRMPFRLIPIAEPREDQHVNTWKSRPSGHGPVVPSRYRTADRWRSDGVFA